jgi:serine/threonine-protein kinase
LGKTCQGKVSYQILKLLGKGGMGRVYLGFTDAEESSNKLVAIKILNKECLFADNYEEIKARFGREIRLLISFNHPNIIKIIDQGILEIEEDNNTYNLPFFVMEYLEGKILSKYLQEKQKLTLEEALPIMLQITAGLMIAHQNNIIHRDLKPENIWLSPTYNQRCIAKILDFGIAKNLSNLSGLQLTNMADFLATPYYISPEHSKGIIELDSRSDIYTLGLIFYEMLTGTKPFDPEDELLQRKGWLGVHNTMIPQPLRTKTGCENLPVQIEQIILKCLEKNPENRFRNGGELLDSLSQLSRLISPPKREVLPEPKPIPQNLPQTTPMWQYLLLFGLGIISGISLGVLIMILFSSQEPQNNNSSSLSLILDNYS